MKTLKEKKCRPISPINRDEKLGNGDEYMNYRREVQLVKKQMEIYSNSLAVR